MNLHDFRRILRQAVFFPLILLLLLAGFFLLRLSEFSATLHALDRTDQVTSRVYDLQRLILSQETGLRGYELTNDPAMLAPYTAGMAPIQTGFADLRHLFADNKEQEQRLSDLMDHYDAWLDRSRRMISKDQVLLARPRIHEENKAMMDNVRSIFSQMLATEAAQHNRLSAEAPDIERSEFISILAACLLIAFVVALFTRQRLHMVSRSYESAVAELKERSKQLFQSRQWFQTTLESIGDAVISCDMEGRIQFLNAVATGLTGWSAQEAMGRPLLDVFHIVHEETRAPAENPIEKVRRLKKVVGLANHTALLSRHGKEFIIDDSAAPIVDANGQMTGVVLVFHDVTEQRRTEAALISSEKLAVAGRLAASIAHEIHNPLDAVSNLLFLLRDEPDRPKRMQYLQMAQQEVGRTMQISRTMLSLYRESKSPVSVELKELIEGVLLLVERRMALQQIQLTTEFAAQCVVEGFPAELRQVITNILVNAIEASGPRGRVRIRLESAAAEEFHGAGAMIEVADSGPGIQDGDASRLFQPFFTTKGEQGTGLGLWVSMGIIQKHGGMIRLTNCTDRDYPGACARIFLPAKTLAREAPRMIPAVQAS